MKNIPWSSAVLVCAASAVLCPAAAGFAPIPPKTAASAAAPSAPQATPLNFRDFFEPTPRELKLSETLRQLNGKRVRITGFIAQMEMPPKGAFFLCAMPVSCSESGAGTGDLPPETVRVIVRGAKDSVIQSIPRAVVVTGILEVGNRPEADGTVSAIRLTLDRPEPLSAKPRTAPPTSPAAKPAKSARKTLAPGAVRP